MSAEELVMKQGHNEEASATHSASLDFFVYLSLLGVSLALMIKQFRMRGQMYEMRHPDGVGEDDTEIDISGEDY
ncbi:hypothetical protein [Rossellomorea sp. LjRoot5]|uniref:hypothetical protein n=1 Tax=Rossellomorea sp. LjRoot5 TaxID=3342331 RepID=UPI003ED0F5BB